MTEEKKPKRQRIITTAQILRALSSEFRKVKKLPTSLEKTKLLLSLAREIEELKGKLNKPPITQPREALEGLETGKKGRPSNNPVTRQDLIYKLAYGDCLEVWHINEEIEKTFEVGLSKEEKEEAERLRKDSPNWTGIDDVRERFK